MRIARVLGVALLVTAVAACGGDDGDDGVGPGPAVFTTLDVQPSTVNVTVNGTQPLTATAKDQNGGNMTGLTVTYLSSDQTKATVSPAGVVTGVALGTAAITATGTVAGVVKTKTVNVTVAAPGQSASVTATSGSTFDPSTVTITRNGSVTWTFQALHNVTFTGTAPTGGNIPDQQSGSASRTFPAAGNFDYRCTIHAGMAGRVTVQ